MGRMTIRIAMFWVATLTWQSAGATLFLDTKSPAFGVDTVYSDDVFIFGNKIKFDSKVRGDLFALCYEIVQSDSIEGNLMAAAYSVQNLGPVTGSYRTFSRFATCNSVVGRNLLMFGQQLTVGPQAMVGKDVNIGGSDVVFQGQVAGSLAIRAGTAVISGSVGHDLDFQGDSLTLNSNADIKGDLNYSSRKKAVIANGARVGGEVNWKRIDTVEPGREAPPERKKMAIENFFYWFAWAVSTRGFLLYSMVLSLLVFVFAILPLPAWFMIALLWVTLAISGNIFILLTRNKAIETEQVLEARFFSSLGLGFIILFVAPVVALVLFSTIFAAPLAVLLLMAFGIACFGGGIYACLFAGRKVCSLLSKNAGRTPGYLCFTIGMIILVALAFIPVFGYFVMLVALMTGLGGLTLTFFKQATEKSVVARP